MAYLDGTELVNRIAQIRELAGYHGFSASFPIPGQVGGHQTDRVFFYSNAASAQRARPLAWMELDGTSGVVLGLNSCYVRDFVDPKVHPLEEVLDYSLTCGGSARDQLERVRRMAGLYGTVRRAAFRAELTQEERQAAEAYLQLLSQASPPALLAYYRALGGEFFRWAEENGLR